MSSITYIRWGALGELMQWHLCPAMDRVLVQPYFIRPPTSCIICSSVLSWSDSDIAIYTAYPPVPALHRSPLSPYPIQDTVSGPQTENRLLCRLPHQPFQLIPTPNQYPAVLDLWGALSTVFLYILVPLSQNQGAVYQHTDGRWKIGPAIPSCSYRPPPMPSVFPQPSVGALDHLWVPPPPDPKQWMQEGASAQHVLSQDSCTCCFFFQDFPPVSGLPCHPI